MSLFLISFAAIIFTCIVLDKVSNRLGVPALLAFLILGLIVGWAHTIDRSQYSLMESVCNIALLLIIFYGGFGVRWQSAKPIIKESSLLASFGVVLTVFITGIACHYVLLFDWTVSLLIAAILGSTDAASVFSILRTRKLGLKNNIAPMLEMESGSNDPFGYIMTVILLSVLAGSLDASHVLWMLFKQVFFGALFGFGIAWGAKRILLRFPISVGGMSSLYIMAVALIAYALPGVVDGNGFLSVYIVGVILGNTHMSDKKELVHFFDGIVNLVQMLLFFLLGLMAKPATMLDAIVPAIVILLIMVFVARPLAIHAILLPFRDPNNIRKCKYTFNQRNFISFVGLRGAASIVFVVMAISQSMLVSDEVYNVIFCVVILSISIQGSLIPYMAKTLKVIDDGEDVMKTFSDFSEGCEMQFGKILIPSNSSWCGKKIADLDIPKNLILALVIRGDEKILPKGRVTLLEGDVVICGLKAWNLEDGIQLREHKMDNNSKWDGVLIKDYPTHHDNVILMIQRGDEQIIPTGKTELKSNDLLVVLETQNGVKRLKTTEA